MVTGDSLLVVKWINNNWYYNGWRNEFQEWVKTEMELNHVEINDNKVM